MAVLHVGELHSPDGFDIPVRVVRGHEASSPFFVHRGNRYG